MDDISAVLPHLVRARTTKLEIMTIKGLQKFKPGEELTRCITNLTNKFATETKAFGAESDAAETLWGLLWEHVKSFLS